MRLQHEVIMLHNLRSMMLLLATYGRSGTGKTTCLVLRMWATYMAYQNSCIRPKILFLTKNDMLRNEVEKSFRNMGLGWRRRSKELELLNSSRAHVERPNYVEENDPTFLTSGEWLDALDENLPGKRFFTSKEAKHRVAFRSGDDSVRRAVDAVLEGKKRNFDGQQIQREEMFMFRFGNFGRGSMRKCEARWTQLWFGWK